jgi:O-antigen/teichoic acid export membrane protein
MRARPSTLKGGIHLSGGQIVSQACSFIRNVILARMISVEDFGVAAAFAMTLSLLEMISNLSLDKQLVQAADGNEPDFQNAAHFVHLTRGIGIGIVLFALAGLVARLFGIPQAVWGFRCLALLPVMRGFLHLDNIRMQREMRFGPAVSVDVISNVLVTLVAWPIAAWFRNYNAMLAILLIQVAVAGIASHWVAERRYSWSWDGRYARRMFTFGWPLLISGLLLYGMMQGDRLVIGSARQLFPGATYTLKDLGEYSIAFSLMMAPAMFIGNVASSLFLPVLARVQAVPNEFQRNYQRAFAFLCLLAALITIPCILAGPQLVVWIYGAKYSAAAGLVGWLAAVWGLRIIRYVPTIAALAYADTQAVMISNLVRSSALCGSIYAAATGKGLVWIAISALAGELLALPVLMRRIRRLHGVSARLCVPPMAAIGLGVIAAAMISYSGVSRAHPLSALLASLVTVGGTTLILSAAAPGLRYDLLSMASRTLGMFGMKNPIREADA